MTSAPSADETFRAISDPTRRAILDALAQGERSVTELCAMFDVTQSAISQHLKVLRDAGLVTPRREGRSRIYRVEAEPLRAVHDWAAHYERFWTEKLDALGALLDREAAIARKGGRS
ncbi:ArsR/SmtB family transcription factor [Sorangium sp. So ce233]|uniref:ArsR/SmtB family transcription factor n=1 Tax=Sorangium sp. So ce233 TaxID=3133290 RepID=UPI003F601006